MTDIITPESTANVLFEQHLQQYDTRRCTPESAAKVRPKCYVPVLTAAPLDVLIPLILNAPHDFINTQFTDEVLRARKEKHMEKTARKYYAEIVFQVNLYRATDPLSDDYWFSLWYENEDPEDDLRETIGRACHIETNIEVLDDCGLVTAEDFIMLKRPCEKHRFSLWRRPKD